MWYIYILSIYIYSIYIEYYSAIKKNEILPFAATRMDLEGIMLSEVSQTKTNTLYNITYMWNLKNTTSEYSKKGADSQIQRTS